MRNEKVDTNLDKLFSLQEIDEDIAKAKQRLKELRWARKKIIERERLQGKRKKQVVQ